MFEAITTHKIEVFGPNIMKLKESSADVDVAIAERPDDTSPWTVSCGKEGVKDVAANSRGDAIQALADMGVEVVPGTFVTVTVPPGLTEAP